MFLHDKQHIAIAAGFVVLAGLAIAGWIRHRTTCRATGGRAANRWRNRESRSRPARFCSCAEPAQLHSPAGYICGARFLWRVSESRTGLLWPGFEHRRLLFEHRPAGNCSRRRAPAAPATARRGAVCRRAGLQRPSHCIPAAAPPLISQINRYRRGIGGRGSGYRSDCRWWSRGRNRSHRWRHGRLHLRPLNGASLDNGQEGFGVVLHKSALRARAAPPRGARPASGASIRCGCCCVGRDRPRK